MPWCPIGKYLWDFWFAQRGEDLHLFYLQASQAECHFHPDARHDRASIGHAMLTAGGWKELHPDRAAFEKGESGAWDDLSIWTGSIVQHPDTEKYHLFYTARSHNDPLIWTPHERQRPQQIGMATSTDLITWKRSSLNPVIPNPKQTAGLEGVAWRDPYILANETGFYALICARQHDPALDAVNAGGLVAIVHSPDLQQWSEAQWLVASQEFYQMEVPQLLWRRFGPQKRLYLLFSAQSGDCSRQRWQTLPNECQTGTYYLKSELVDIDAIEFPPLQEPARLLAGGLYAGKLLHPEKLHPWFYGFHWADATGRFLGGLSDPIAVEFTPAGEINLTQNPVC